jgi:hypothetical protein
VSAAVLTPEELAAKMLVRSIEERQAKRIATFLHERRAAYVAKGLVPIEDLGSIADMIGTGLYRRGM